MKPGFIERREFEYIRHGTLSLIAGLNVASGKIVSSTMAPTRDEIDFVKHIEYHQSESLVRLVARHCGLNDPLGQK